MEEDLQGRIALRHDCMTPPGEQFHRVPVVVSALRQSSVTLGVGDMDAEPRERAATVQKLGSERAYMSQMG